MHAATPPRLPTLSNPISTCPFIPEPCPICGEMMSRPVSAQSILRHRKIIPDVEARAVYCESGHGFCLSCWSTHLSTQVRENGGYALQCPGFKCGELLDPEWAPVMLSEELTNRWSDQRLRHLVDCNRALRWCKHEGCELVVHVVGGSEVLATHFTESSTGESKC